MSSGTGTATVPGSQSSTNPAEKVKQNFINGAASVALSDTTQSGTTAARDIAYPSPTGGENWDNTTLGYRQFYNAASAAWEKDQALINGAASVQTSSGSEWLYGTWPEDRYDASTSTAENATDNTAHIAVTDQDNYSGLIFKNTTGNVTIQISLDGTTFIAADHPFIDMGVAARTIVTGTNTNVGPFLMNTPCKAFKFLNEGAVQSVVTFAQIGKVDI